MSPARRVLYISAVAIQAENKEPTWDTFENEASPGKMMSSCTPHQSRSYVLRSINTAHLIGLTGLLVHPSWMPSISLSEGLMRENPRNIKNPSSP